MVGLNNRVLLQVGSTGAAWINATADYTAWAEYKGELTTIIFKIFIKNFRKSNTLRI